MREYCKQAESTPLGYYCSVTGQECLKPFSVECDEPEWDYLMRIAEDYVEEDSEN